MKKVHTNKGFTLAELLIVVAVIAVLVAIAIPTFSDQLEKSREAKDLSELRAAYASVMAASLESPKTDTSVEVTLFQTRNDWQSSEVIIAGTDISTVTPAASGKMYVKYAYNSGAPAITIENDAATPAKVTVSDKFAASLNVALTSADDATYTGTSFDATAKLKVNDAAFTTTGYTLTATSANENLTTSVSSGTITFGKKSGVTDAVSASVTITVTETATSKTGSVTITVSLS